MNSETLSWMTWRAMERLTLSMGWPCRLRDAFTTGRGGSPSSIPAVRAHGAPAPRGGGVAIGAVRCLSSSASTTRACP